MHRVRQAVPVALLAFAMGLAGITGPVRAQVPMPGHKAMAPGTMTGDPGRDLVAMMRPHHQGAIDMARICLTL